MQIARDLFIHLRLHFQLLLAPIFLWGFTLSETAIDLRFWLGFVAFHLCLYGGTTAFNSYYDRDEGPVGGLENPPPAHEALLPFSLILQGIGASIDFCDGCSLFTPTNALEGKAIGWSTNGRYWAGNSRRVGRLAGWSKWLAQSVTA